MLSSAEGGDTAGVHKSANGSNDDGAGVGANEYPCGNGDSFRGTAASPYSSQGPDLQQLWLNQCSVDILYQILKCIHEAFFALGY